MHILHIRTYIIRKELERNENTIRKISVACKCENDTKRNEYICLVCFDSTSLSFKFLTRLPGVCSGGGRGFPPETLDGLTRNPLSSTLQGLNPGPPAY